MKIIELEEVDSTNDYIKRSDFQEEVIVTAARQTGGRGTKGRSFISDEGGLYLSALRLHKNFDSSKTFSIMIDSCVAVCRTLEKFGFEPKVKWPNDVLVGGRKICGTLIENRLSSGHMCRSIVGIGLNVNNSFTGELQGIATSMRLQGGRAFDLSKVRGVLIENLSRTFTVEDYKRYIDWFGREIVLVKGEERLTAIAVDVDPSGRLVVRAGGNILHVSSGEVSLRLV